MSKHMEQGKLQAMAEELAKDIKSEADLSALSAELLKLTVETALNAEQAEHLGYGKHDPDGHHSGNSRNGHTEKTLKSRHGAVKIKTPRDRNGTFDPQIVQKGQIRLTEFDDQILSFYARGMTTRDMVDAFEEVYGATVSATTISAVTDAVIERVEAWQCRPLDTVYPIVYLDGLVWSRSTRISVW